MGKGRVTYRDIPQLVREKRSFCGHSMSAGWARGDMLGRKERRLHEAQYGEIVGWDWYYVVWSYSTPIAVVGDATGTVATDLEKYSHTTTRHQNIVREVKADPLGWHRKD